MQNVFIVLRERGSQRVLPLIMNNFFYGLNDLPSLRPTNCGGLMPAAGFISANDPQKEIGEEILEQIDGLFE